MLNETKVLDDAASKWLDIKGVQTQEPLIKIGQLNMDTLRNLMYSVGRINDSYYTSFELFKKENGARLEGVGLLTPGGDYLRWGEHYDENGNEFVLGNTGEQKQIKSLRNYPQCSRTVFSDDFLHDLYTSFPGIVRSVIQNLTSGGVIGVHSDSVDQERKRVHINITNAEVVYFIGGNAFKMTPGGIYWFNSFLMHAVENKTKYDRKNLIIDCFYNGSVSDFVTTSRQTLTTKQMLEI
jgi:hypothetical protein